MRSMDDLPNIPEENWFAFSADFVENLLGPGAVSTIWRHDPATCPLCSMNLDYDWGY